MVCPVCGGEILIEDMDVESWPSASKLGPVHRRCLGEAVTSYQEYLDDMREEEAALDNRKERDL